jgi:D-amino-acid dehydrogenase
VRIVVIGAGLIGVTTAWYLAEQGHAVTVLDRNPAPAEGASFANGGLVTPSTSDSWAAPGTPLKILKWLGQEDAPMLLRLRALPGMVGWGLRFLRECREKHWRANTRATFALARASLEAFNRLAAEQHLAFDRNPPGLIKLFRDPLSMDSAVRASRLYQELGYPLRALAAEGCIAEEPSLAPIRGRIAGGILYPADESGDAHGFARALASLCESRGVVFHQSVAAHGFDRDRKIKSVATSSGNIAGDAFVLATGAQSAPLARQLGLRLPVYPAKGYSLTVRHRGWNRAPRRPIVDDGRKAAFTPLGDRIRVAGTVEFDGWNTGLNAARGRMLEQALHDVFPELATDNARGQWSGLRPLTPDGRPIVGGSDIPNLFLNTGHGPLGLTLACGSGLALAELISGDQPSLDLSPYRWPRPKGLH